jgi:Legionella pneumophila major outer membrane protein precursor
MCKGVLFYFTTVCCFFHSYVEALPRSGFFTQGAALYLQAEETGLGYAVKSCASDRSLRSSRVKNPKFDWDVGFNIGLGYRVPHDCWQLLAQFTSLQTHSDATQSTEENCVFFPSWLSSDLPFLATGVKAHWRLHFGLIDLLLSKPYSAGRTLTLTPQIGIRWGSARQKFNLIYRSEEIVVRMKNKYAGLGPYMGLLGEYALVKDFSLFARGAFSLLYGEFYLHQDEDVSASKEKLLGLHAIFRSCAALLEGGAGIRWQHLFTGALKRLKLDLSWEQYLFFSQNQLFRSVDPTHPGIVIANQGDLSLSGVRFGIAFDF